jgi:hypothetical protein
MKWIFGGFCLLVATTTLGQTIYKCRDAKGGLVYQSTQCAMPEKRWDTQPGTIYGSASDDSRMTRAEAEASIERDRRALKKNSATSSYRIGRASGASVSRTQQPACIAARNGRAAAKEAAGVRWNYTQASYWDRQVFAACK